MISYLVILLCMEIIVFTFLCHCYKTKFLQDSVLYKRNTSVGGRVTSMDGPHTSWCDRPIRERHLRGWPTTQPRGVWTTHRDGASVVRLPFLVQMVEGIVEN